MTDTTNSNTKTTRAYFEGFLDVSGGNLFFSNNNIESRCHFFINNCDISLNGATYETGDISLNFQIHEKQGNLRQETLAFLTPSIGLGPLRPLPSLNNDVCEPPTTTVANPPTPQKTKNPLRWFLGF
jgi:hypothetical protein